ncbi:MAG: hypothetical protein WB511_09050, partial [Nitrososphaeraceae archaeon]
SYCHSNLDIFIFQSIRNQLINYKLILLRNSSVLVHPIRDRFNPLIRFDEYNNRNEKFLVKISKWKRHNKFEYPWLIINEKLLTQ